MNGDKFDREKELNEFLQYMEYHREQKKIRKQLLKEKLKPNIIFILLFSAYIIMNTTNIARFGNSLYNVEVNANINIMWFGITLVILFSVLLGINLLLLEMKNFHRFVLFFSSMVYAVGLVAHKNLNMAYNITVLAVLFYIINYCFHRRDEAELPEFSELTDLNEPTQNEIGNISNKDDGISFAGLDRIISFRTAMILISVLVLAYTVVLSETCIARYKAFWSSTYDFGIFAQMFENMAKTGLQITSVERNMRLSHFAVHFSPIYYLLLPVYMIFRSPESLLVMQTAAVALGAFPLALIARKFKLSNTNILLIIITYLFYPALNGGLFFDFHENKFLTVLILWLIYFMISATLDNSKNLVKYIFVYVFALLVLTVKEDSFLYVFCMALYMLTLKKDGKFVRWNILSGTAIAGMSILYFLFSTYWLQTRGLGVMTYRYDLFLKIGEDGFGAMIVNVIKNPALLLGSLISVPEKLEFLLYMLIPLCFLPFISKKLNFVLLIVPMIIMNLATDYIYQYDVNFQYTYGVTALLFFLAVKNLSKINTRHIAKICVMMACFSIILFTSKNFNRIHSYHFVYYTRRSEFIETEEMLKQIPMDASVSASTFIVPHLIKRENVYMVDIFDENYFKYETEYLVNDLRGVDIEQYKEFLGEIDQKGYKKIDESVFVEIFRKVETD